jgi:hypothetical protein
MGDVDLCHGSTSGSTSGWHLGDINDMGGRKMCYRRRPHKSTRMFERMCSLSSMPTNDCVRSNPACENATWSTDWRDTWWQWSHQQEKDPPRELTVMISVAQGELHWLDRSHDVLNRVSSFLFHSTTTSTQVRTLIGPIFARSRGNVTHRAVPSTPAVRTTLTTSGVVSTNDATAAATLLTSGCVRFGCNSVKGRNIDCTFRFLRWVLPSNHRQMSLSKTQQEGPVRLHSTSLDSSKSLGATSFIH